MKKGIVDEMTLPDGTIRGYYAEVAAWLNGLSRVDLMRNQKEAEAIFRRSGITFAIYGGLESNRAADPFRYHPAAVRGGRVAAPFGRHRAAGTCAQRLHP